MASIYAIFILFCLVSEVIECHASYQPPEPLIQAFSPIGLRVSIPDVKGIELFAFHGQVNKPMMGREQGLWGRDATIRRPTDGRFTIYDSTAKLNIGDKIYYWFYVVHFDGERRVGITRTDKVFTITALLNDTESEQNITVSPEEIIPFVLTSQASTPGLENPLTIPRLCLTSLTKLTISQPFCSGDLIFEDTFDNLSTTKFTSEVRIADQPDFPFMVYMKNEENLMYKNGSVIIKPTLLEQRYESVRGNLDITEICTATVDSDLCLAKAVGAFILPPIISAKITTKNTFSFTYGRIEVIAKVPIGDWIYPEIQLESKDSSYGVNNYASGIMRVAFTKGNLKYAKDLEAGVIMDSDKDVRGINMKYKTGINNWNNDFHNYTMVWKPDQVNVFVDGEEYGTIVPGREGINGTRGMNNPAEQLWWRGTILAPFDKPFYIALGVAVGGNEFEDLPDKPWVNDSPRAKLSFWKAKSSWHRTWTDESSLQVESVRVFAL